ncbi:MntP/YtaF family protein [Paenibacillus agilis]|uniref:Sporulation membrane protein YtaF n=1 Tax=Paenibacillus agilis TaxID=3020863 RepID=A0A559IXJ2_9BACL|nr:MntP/YtaF family protein [Paenibacillus agilis]TVX92349.1 sporulation membrane protein YtaF [Paenibacillus agilis]
MVVFMSSVFILAFALSLDSFGVGMTYGLRRVRIGWLPVAIIAGCSGLVLYVSMQIGTIIMQVFSADVSRWIGALLLIGIGCWVLVQFFRTSSEDDEVVPQTNDIADPLDKVVTSAIVHVDTVPAETTREIASTPATLFHLQLKRLGIIIHILRSPAAADMDRSGTISPSEAAWLGAALSLDAFGAGIGAAMLGYPSLWTSLFIALFGGIFLKLGIHVGAAFARTEWIRKLTFLPGLLLIMMGIMKLM